MNYLNNRLKTVDRRICWLGVQSEEIKPEKA